MRLASQHPQMLSNNCQFLTCNGPFSTAGISPVSWFPSKWISTRYGMASRNCRAPMKQLEPKSMRCIDTVQCVRSCVSCGYVIVLLLLLQ